MLSNNTIAVIGGAGKSGQFVVKELIRQLGAKDYLRQAPFLANIRYLQSIKQPT